MDSNDNLYDIARWYREYIRLRSLLKSMTCDDLEESVSNCIKNEQISFAKRLIGDLHRNAEQLKMKLESEQEIVTLNILLERIEKNTSDAIRHVSRKLECTETSDDSDQRLLDYVFKDDIPSDDEDSISYDFITDHSTLTSTISSSKPTLINHELQLHQDETIEDEISQMASQLKKSSIAIKATLLHQNRQLEEMESLTQANLEKTKDITDKVTDEVKRGWRKTASRWLILIIVLITWSFCFLTIRVIPKRKNACLFFCKSKRKSDEHSGSEPTKLSENQDRDSIIHPKQKPPMYSFCKDNGKICTQPMDPDMHIKSMEMLSTHPAEDFAFDLVDQFKLDRESEHFSRAQQEMHDVASKRVTEGWKSQNEEKDLDLDDSNDTDELDSNLFSDDEKRNKVSFTIHDMIQAAVNNEYFTLRKVLKSHPEWATVADGNGWQAVHEAAYHGSLDTLRILIEEFDVDVNARTGTHNGSLLWWASQKFEASHPIIMYLETVGAISIPPAVSSESFDSSEL